MQFLELWPDRKLIMAVRIEWRRVLMIGKRMVFEGASDNFRCYEWLMPVADLRRGGEFSRGRRVRYRLIRFTSCAAQLGLLSVAGGSR